MKANCTRQYPHICTVASTDIPTKTMMDELGHSSIQDYHKREQVSTRNSAAIIQISHNEEWLYQYGIGLSSIQIGIGHAPFIGQLCYLLYYWGGSAPTVQ